MKKLSVKLKVGDYRIRFALAELDGSAIRLGKARLDEYAVSSLSFPNEFKRVAQESIKSEHIDTDSIDSELVYFVGKFPDRQVLVDGKNKNYQVDDFLKKLFVIYMQSQKHASVHYYDIDFFLHGLSLLDKIESKYDFSFVTDVPGNEDLVNWLSEVADGVMLAKVIILLNDYLEFVGQDFNWSAFAKVTANDIFEAFVVNEDMIIANKVIDHLGKYFSPLAAQAVLLVYSGVGTLSFDNNKDQLRSLKKEDVHSQTKTVAVRVSGVIERTVRVRRSFDVLESAKYATPNSDFPEYLLQPQIRPRKIDGTCAVGRSAVYKACLEGLNKIKGVELKLLDFNHAGKLYAICERLLESDNISFSKNLEKAIAETLVEYGDINKDEVESEHSFMKIHNTLARIWRARSESYTED